MNIHGEYNWTATRKDNSTECFYYFSQFVLIQPETSLLRVLLPAASHTAPFNEK